MVFNIKLVWGDPFKTKIEQRGALYFDWEQVVNNPFKIRCFGSITLLKEAAEWEADRLKNPSNLN